MTIYSSAAWVLRARMVHNFLLSLLVLFPYGILFMQTESQTKQDRNTISLPTKKFTNTSQSHFDTPTIQNTTLSTIASKQPIRAILSMHDFTSVLDAAPYTTPSTSPFLAAFLNPTAQQCTCEQLFSDNNASPEVQYLKTFQYTDAFAFPEELERTRKRRANRAHKFFQRHSRPRSKTLHRPPPETSPSEGGETGSSTPQLSSPDSLVHFDSKTPISYTAGRVIKPLDSLQIGADFIFEFLPEVLETSRAAVLEARFSVGLGVLSVNGCDIAGVEGDGTASLKITIGAAGAAGAAACFQGLVYTNLFYLPKGSVEGFKIRVNVRGGVSVERVYDVVIPITVEFPPMPVLVDPGPSLQLDEEAGQSELNSVNVEAMVTIVTKTFERNDCILNLIQSVRKFYPSIRIIVADDNQASKRTSLHDHFNVDHYHMPFSAGWNAGRNLAISQVNTEYLVWVDDDFVFTKYTDLAFWLNFLENMPLYDMVGGRVGEKKLFGYASKLHYDAAGCAARTGGTFRAVEDSRYMTLCQVGDVIQNFYMARTLSLRQVGFDNSFKRFAHKEFFMDGRGKLMIASCPNSVIVNHSQQECSANDGVYGKYRKPTTREWTNVMKRWYFRSNLQCMREKSIMPTVQQMQHKRRRRKALAAQNFVDGSTTREGI